MKLLISNVFATVAFASVAHAQFAAPADSMKFIDFALSKVSAAKSFDDVEKAIEQLQNATEKGITPEQGVAILRAAARDFPKADSKERSDAFDPCEKLVEIAEKGKHETFRDLLRELTPKYTSRGQTQALNLMASLPSRKDAIAYLELIDSLAKSGKSPTIATGTFSEEPRHADILFPKLLEHATNANSQWSVFYTTFSYLEKNKLNEKLRAACVEPALAAWKPLKPKVVAAQKTDGGIAWMWDEKYQNDFRHLIGIVLDVIGDLEGEATESELKDALKLHDPRLKYFAVKHLLRRGVEVDKEHIDAVAASAEMRLWFFNELKKAKKSELFPKRYRTQAALAEADMVRWLIYPTELGRAPDEIELMKVLPSPADANEDFYVYRFRTHEPHWSADDGWQAGVAGPYPRKGEPTSDGGGGTFSRFDKWEEHTAEQHLERIHGGKDDQGLDDLMEAPNSKE